MQTRAAVEKFVTLNIVCIGDLYTGRIYQTAQRDILDNLSFQYPVRPLLNFENKHKIV